MKTVKFLFGLFLAVIVCATTVKAQLDSAERVDIIKKKFNEAELKKMTSAEQQIKQANSMMSKAGSQISQTRDLLKKSKSASKRKERKQAKKTLKKSGGTAKKTVLDASKIYETGLKDLYTLYKDKLTEISSGADPKKVKEVDLVKESAKSAFIKASQDIQNASKLSDEEKVINTLLKAHDSKINALKNLQGAFCLLIDCDPKPVVIPVDIPTVDSTEIKAQMAEEKRKEEERLRMEEANRLVYKVQILAVTKQASPDQLKQFYSGADKIDEFLDASDNLYKYSVGNFKTYKEAEALRVQLGINQSFVVAFKGGQRINVKDAMKMEKPN